MCCPAIITPPLSANLLESQWPIDGCTGGVCGTIVWCCESLPARRCYKELISLAGGCFALMFHYLFWQRWFAPSIFFFVILSPLPNLSSQEPLWLPLCHGPEFTFVSSQVESPSSSNVQTWELAIIKLLGFFFLHRIANCKNWQWACHLKVRKTSCFNIWAGIFL